MRVVCRGPAAASSLLLLGAALVTGAPSGRAEGNGRARLGALVLHYDPAEWDVAETVDGIAASCRGAGCGRPTVEAGLSAEGEAPCGAVLLASRLPRPGSRPSALRRVTARDGLEVSVLSASIGCRNARPDWVEACASHQGRTYLVSAPVRACRGGPGFGSDEALWKLLSGLALR